MSGVSPTAAMSALATSAKADCEPIDTRVECPICFRIFANVTKLEPHLESHLGLQTFECSVCNVKFSQKGTLGTHMITHLPGRSFSCIICMRQVPQKEMLKHMEKHTDLVYECILCHKRLINMVSLETHMDTHFGSPGHKCFICSQVFLNSSFLNEHMDSHHSGEAYECILCCESYASESLLLDHLHNHNMDLQKKNYECTICSRTFTDMEFLLKHMKGHSEDDKSTSQDKYSEGDEIGGSLEFHFKDVEFQSGEDTRDFTEIQSHEDTRDPLHSHRDGDPLEFQSGDDSKDQEKFNRDPLAVQSGEVSSKSHKKISSGGIVKDPLDFQSGDDSKDQEKFNRDPLAVQSGEVSSKCHKKSRSSDSIKDPLELSLSEGRKIDLGKIHSNKKVKDIVELSSDEEIKDPLECAYSEEVSEKRETTSSGNSRDDGFVRSGDKFKGRRKRAPGKNYFECAICHKLLKLPDDYLNHLQLHKAQGTTKKVAQTADIKNFECVMCNEKFYYRGALKVHMKCHNVDQFPCSICRSVFISKDTLLRHKDREHPNHSARNDTSHDAQITSGSEESDDSDWSPFNEESFEWKSTKKRRGGPGQKYTCLVCEKVLNHKSSFNRHMKNHSAMHCSMNQSKHEVAKHEVASGDRRMITMKYTCSICNKIFPDKKILALHLERHLKAKSS